MMKKLPVVWSAAIAVVFAANLSACGPNAAPAAESVESPPTRESPRLAGASQKAPKVFQRVEMQGALVADYGVESFDDFAKSSFVSKVVVGRVLSSESRVYTSGGDDVVYKEVRIEPDDAPGTVIVTRESGGMASVRELTASLSGHMSEEELTEKGDQVVEYVSTDFPVHSAVGDRVLVLLSGQPSGLSYFSAATLIQDESGAFVWPAAPPNDAWARSVTAEQGERMVRDLT